MANITTQDADKSWNKTYGFKPDGRTPLLDYHKFEAAKPKVQERYIRLWERAYQHLKSLTRAELLEALAPYSGSVEAFQWSLLRNMREWYHLVLLETYRRNGAANPALVMEYNRLCAIEQDDRRAKDNSYSKSSRYAA